MLDRQQGENQRRAGRWVERAHWQVLMVVAACVVVYWVGLGVKPLDFSEGHRAVPGWTMLRTGEWWKQEMFGLTYVRKPPGMAWAIAASSKVFGETVFAARAVSAMSATLLALCAWWYSRRWFGARWALLGGLAQALMPTMWAAGRSAEIEMLMLLGAGMMAMAGVELMVRGGGGSGNRESGSGNREVGVGDRESGVGIRERYQETGRRGARWLWVLDVLVCALGVVIAALAKGPAAAGVLVGVVVGGAIGARSVRVLWSWRVWVALGLAAGVLVYVGKMFAEANADPGAVREDVAKQFLWSMSRVWGVVGLMPTAWASMLPMSAAVVCGVWWWTRGVGGSDVGKRESGFGNRDSGIGDREWGEGERVARVVGMLAWAWVVSVLVLVLAGVSNHRYALASAVVLGALVAGVFKFANLQICKFPNGVEEGERAARGGLMLSRRIELGLLGLGVVLMSVGGGLAVKSMWPTRDQMAGVELAARLVEAAPVGVQVWADDAIEARPDVLWMLEQRATGLRRGLSVVWAKREMSAGGLPRRGDCVLLRTDVGSGEAERYKEEIVSGRLERVSGDKVRGYEFTLFRVKW